MGLGKRSTAELLTARSRDTFASEPTESDNIRDSKANDAESARTAASAGAEHRSAQEIVREIGEELTALKGAALRGRLRQLQLLWHPDRAWRYHDDMSLCCQVFT